MIGVLVALGAIFGTILLPILLVVAAIALLAIGIGIMTLGFAFLILTLTDLAKWLASNDKNAASFKLAIDLLGQVILTLAGGLVILAGALLLFGLGATVGGIGAGILGGGLLVLALGIGAVALSIFGLALSFKFMYSTVTTIMDDLGHRIAVIWAGIVQTIRNSINGIVYLINTGFINNINHMISGISSLGSQIGVNIVGTIQPLGYLASGGYATGASLNVIGEAGSEVALPLDNNTDWAEKVANLINGAGGGNGQNIIVNLGEERIFEKFVDYVKNRSATSQTNFLGV